MKIYLTKPRNHWLSPYTVLEKIFFWREIDYDEPIIEKWSDRLTPFCNAWQKLLDIVHPKVHYVKIDPYDTWSLDYTFSLIAVPLLKQLKANLHGAPNVDDDDVPDHLKSTAAPPREEEHSVDDNHFLRWDWVLDEMIWAHEQIVNDDESQFFDHSEVDLTKSIFEQVGKTKVDEAGLKTYNDRIANGLRLFGKYYRGLWD